MQHRGISTKAITASAIKIVKAAGVDELSMPKIAQDLGIRSQSLYNHVGNLNEVKTAMSIELFETLKARLFEGVLGLTGERAVRAYFDTFYQFCLEYCNFNELLFLPGKDSSARLSQAFQGVIQVLHTLLSGFVTTPAQIQLATRTLMSLFVGFVLNDANNVYQDSDKQAKANLDEMLTLIFKAIK